MFMSLPVSAIDAVPGIIGVLAVTSAIGYVGVAINAVRRLRSGELRGISASLPGFRLVWDGKSRGYDLRTPFGRITVGSRSPRSVDEYVSRVNDLTTKARQAAVELDAALEEMAAAVGDRRTAIAQLEAQLEALRRVEVEQQERVERLSAIEPAVAKEFVALLDVDLARRERSGSRRDLLLFVLGVIATIIVSTIFYALT
jgi:hypothetical protein